MKENLLEEKQIIEMFEDFIKKGHAKKLRIK